MKNLISSLKQLILVAGEIALTVRANGLVIETKIDQSPVSNADKQISQLIYDSLSALTPGVAVICEEQPLVNLTSDTFWLIDPIDGTKSYVQGEDSYTVNIGLIKNGVPIIGLIYQPSCRKLHYTDSDNNLKIEQNSVEVTLIDHGLSNSLRAVVSANHPNIETVAFLDKHSINQVVSMPSSIKLCLIAEGQADIYPKFGQTMEWDIAAGHALIKATGGHVVDFAGKEIIYGKKGFENPNFYAYGKKWLNR